MAGLIATLTEVMAYGPEGQGVFGGPKYAAMTIGAVDPRDPSKLYRGNVKSPILPQRTFQYWPETISDSYEIGWSFKDIPGASTALAQWASNNGRTISFEVHLHRYTRPLDSRTNKDKAMDPIKKAGPSAYPAHNVDVKNEIQYLRGYCYPTYEEIGGIKAAYPPPVTILNIPGLGLNETNGGDAIFAVMTQCDVNYLLLFADGTPRHATVSLAFRQIVQKGNAVYFKGWPNYKIDNSEQLASGGGRYQETINVGDVK